MLKETLDLFVELFKTAFTENCKIEEEELNPSDIAVLDELEPVEIFENFKDLISQLLKYKEQSKNAEKSDLIQELEKFESLTQRLESDIRKHISIEQQLKIHIESSETKIEYYEKQIDMLKERTSALEDQLKDKENYIKSIEKEPVSHLEAKLREVEERFKREISNISALHREKSYRTTLLRRSGSNLIKNKSNERLRTGLNTTRKLSGNKSNHRVSSQKQRTKKVHSLQN